MLGFAVACGGSQRARRRVRAVRLGRVSLRRPATGGVSGRSAVGLPRVRLAARRFFFQAEDGIRDTSVTGVQTCALPILFGGTPAEVPESYHRSNPLTYVERVRVPMLLLVGQNDPRCPSRSVDIYADRLRALGKPPDEYRYDAGHGSLVIDEQIKQMTMELAFAARHLGTRPPIA